MPGCIAGAFQEQEYAIGRMDCMLAYAAALGHAHFYAYSIAYSNVALYASSPQLMRIVQNADCLLRH